MSQNDIQAKIASFTCIEEALDYFDIGFDSRFIDKYRVELVKRFNGYLILTKPEDWFSARRALKNAYCKVQRSLLEKLHAQLVVVALLVSVARKYPNTQTMYVSAIMSFATLPGWLARERVIGGITIRF